MGQLCLAKKKVFGGSSEQADEQLMEQLSFLFNEPETWASRDEKQPEHTTVSAHTRQKRSGCDLRKLRFTGDDCPYHGAEVCHGFPAVPAG